MNSVHIHIEVAVGFGDQKDWFATIGNLSATIGVLCTAIGVLFAAIGEKWSLPRLGHLFCFLQNFISTSTFLKDEITNSLIFYHFSHENFNTPQIHWNGKWKYISIVIGWIDSAKKQQIHCTSQRFESALKWFWSYSSWIAIERWLLKGAFFRNVHNDLFSLAPSRSLSLFKTWIVSFVVYEKYT